MYHGRRQDVFVSLLGAAGDDTDAVLWHERVLGRVVQLDGCACQVWRRWRHHHRRAQCMSSSGVLKPMLCNVEVVA